MLLPLFDETLLVELFSVHIQDCYNAFLAVQVVAVAIKHVFSEPLVLGCVLYCVIVLLCSYYCAVLYYARINNNFV